MRLCRNLIDALVFPFRKDNLLLVALGTVLSSIPPIVGRILPDLPYVSIIAWIVEGFVICYSLIYFQSVLNASARNEEKLPLWPDESDFQELAADAFRVIIPVVLAFFPLIILLVLRVFTSGTWRLTGWAFWAAIALTAIGFAYLPIALLIYSFYGELAVLNFLGGVRSIARIGKAYFFVVVFLFVLVCSYIYLAARLAGLPPILGIPIGALLFFCVMISSMRAVGLLYASHRERLGWP
jgi:hypothetical protein